MHVDVVAYLGWKGAWGVTRVVQPHPAAEDLDTPLFDLKIFLTYVCQTPSPKVACQVQQGNLFYHFSATRS
jgi:hypothetical protein